MGIFRKLLHRMKYWAAMDKLDMAVRQFHDQLNQCNFQGVFSAAHADFKAARNEKGFFNLLRAIHTKLGKLEGLSETANRVRSEYCPEKGRWKTYFVLTYKSRYANGDATEMFTYEWELDRDASEAPVLLYDYKIDSWALTRALAENGD